jgi:hypothetical protein
MDFSTLTALQSMLSGPGEVRFSKDTLISVVFFPSSRPFRLVVQEGELDYDAPSAGTSSAMFANPGAIGPKKTGVHL